MRIVRANNELRDLQDRLREAVESEDLSLMGELTNKINNIRNPTPEVIFTKGRYGYIRIDSRTHKQWVNFSSDVDIETAKKILDEETRNGYRLPKASDFDKLLSGLKEPYDKSLTKAGFFNAHGVDQIWAEESRHGNVSFNLEIGEIVARRVLPFSCWLLFIID